MFTERLFPKGTAFLAFGCGSFEEYFNSKRRSRYLCNHESPPATLALHVLV